MISYAIAGLLFVILIVLCVLAAKTWHWVNIVFLILCFIAGSAAIGAMSQTYQLRRKAMKGLDTNTKRLVKNEKDFNQAIYGSADSLSYERDCLRGINEELGREMAGRGRIWSNGNATSLDSGNAQFKFKQARDEVTDTNRIEGVVLHVFADDAQNYPVTYVATVQVVSEDAGQVELQPIFVADNEAFNGPQGTWSLFEKMPMDRRNAFKRLEGLADDHFVDTDAASLNGKISAYREVLMTKYMTPAEMGMEAGSEEYEALIDRHCFDGLEIGQIERWIESQGADRIITRFEPKPEEIFVKYKFDKKSNRAFVVDADGDISSGGVFTPNGQAIDPSLRAGKDITFAKDEIILVDLNTSNGYQRGENIVERFENTQPVTEVGKVYLRELRDFPYLLNELQQQSIVFQKETTSIQAATAVTVEAWENAQSQIQARAALTEALRDDDANLEKDLATIKRLFTDRDSELVEIQEQLKTLKSEIQAKYKKLNAMRHVLSKQASGVANR